MFKIKFNSYRNTIQIDDEAKSQYYFFCVFVILQFISNGAQVYQYWGDYSSWQFYVFSFLFIVFLVFTVFFLFYNSHKDEIHLQNLAYYSERTILWSKLRYFKLKNNQVRLININGKSSATPNLVEYLHEHKVSIRIK